MNVLDRSFYERATEVVAFELIGKILRFDASTGCLSGRIVETEAYLGKQDPASHAFCGVTSRNEVMYGTPGVSYVYFSYGNHHCFNCVTEKKGVAGAVLIRSLEPLTGLDRMRLNRNVRHDIELTSGPGKLTQALGLTKCHSGLDLCGGSAVCIQEPGELEEILGVHVTERIGISRARKELLRFCCTGSPFLSRKNGYQGLLTNVHA